MNTQESATKNHAEILVVEDSLTQAEYLKNILEQEGFKVSLAFNGKEALKLINESRPTVVVSDIIMPEMDGFELCRLIKSDKSLKNVPVILLTSLSDPADIIRGLLSGADNFVVKPYDEKYLLSRIEYILINRKLREQVKTEVGLAIYFGGQRHSISSDRLQILDLLLSTYETAVQKNQELAKVTNELRELNEELEERVKERTKVLSVEIEQRKWAEEKVALSEQRLAEALEISEAAVITTDEAQCIIALDSQTEKIFGYSSAELIGKPLDVLIPQRFVEAHRQHVVRFGQSSESYRRTHNRPEITGQRKDGTEFPAEAAISKLTQGGAATFTVVLRDITRRKQAEEALRESERQLSLVYNNVSDIIFYLTVESDERFRFVSVNPAFMKATGLAEGQVVGKFVREVIPEPSLTMVLGKYNEAIRDKKTVKWEETSAYPAGTKHGEVSVTPIFDANGRCTNLIGAVHDITERKNAEEQVRKLNDELEQRVVERTAELEAANTELEAFSYSVSHDLRAPLRAIDGFSRILYEDHASKLDDEGLRILNVVRTSTQQMGQLIDDLLAFSRIGRKQVEKRTIDMRYLATSIADELKPTNRSVEFSINELPEAYGDTSMIRQVFVNLVSNAVKFTRNKEHALIEMRGYAEGDQNIYYVKDNGAGFDERYSNKLFGVFQRLHTADEFEGTGVGLAIVQRIIHKHGGKVWTEGKVNEGATFYFSLPKG
ncbi:MAG: PAS domain S-box protein [Bacteroidetes bacterium]|nr:PAS domain S-box protein [Bacteroidota bacterium]